jgi:hypothetical protein
METRVIRRWRAYAFTLLIVFWLVGGYWLYTYGPEFFVPT